MARWHEALSDKLRLLGYQTIQGWPRPVAQGCRWPLWVHCCLLWWPACLQQGSHQDSMRSRSFISTQGCWRTRVLPWRGCDYHQNRVKTIPHFLSQDIHQKCLWQDWETVWDHSEELWLTTWGGISPRNWPIRTACGWWSDQIQDADWECQLGSDTRQIWHHVCQFHHGKIFGSTKARTSEGSAQDFWVSQAPCQEEDCVWHLQVQPHWDWVCWTQLGWIISWCQRRITTKHACGQGQISSHHHLLWCWPCPWPGDKKVCHWGMIFLNKTPVQWYSKRQATVESSTYGSELVAARIATELTMAMRYRLRMLGVPIDGPADLLGDNKSVITNCTIPSSTLKKKHNAIAYHRVREAVAAKSHQARTHFQSVQHCWHSHQASRSTSALSS